MECNNCGHTDFQLHTNAKCNWYKTPLTVVKCKNCELVFLDPRPDKSLGNQYFNEAYSNADGFEAHSYYRDHDQIFLRNNNRFEILQGLKSPNKNILDIGAGQGHFVKVCQDKGWNATGIELSTEAINSAKELFNIKLLNSIEDLPSNFFGVITLWDVIEHLDDPKGLLIQLSKLLHKDGFFIIETSNINSYDYLINKIKWSYWHVDHYFYYSNYTLGYLLNTIGFEVVNINNAGIPSASVQQRYLKKIKKLINLKIFFKNVKWFIYLLTKKNVSNNSLMTIVAKRSNNGKGLNN